MKTLRLAFWNVENLFPWRWQHPRGPKSNDEYKAKVAAVAGTIVRLFGKHPADVVGLAEIGTRSVLSDILSMLPNGYAIRFSEGSRYRSGLGLIYSPNTIKLAPLRPYPDKVITMATVSRPWYFQTRLTHLATKLDILLVINHWKSNVRQKKKGNITNRRIRRETASSLGEALADHTLPRSLPVILLGDFNVDPFNEVFNTSPLRCRRSFTTIDDWESPTANFYNPTWRFLSPADSSRAGKVAGYHEPRPQTTHATGDSILDQVLLSKSLLTHPRIDFCDTTVRIYHDNTIGKFTRAGRLSPRRWSKVWSVGAAGVSDHFPICAELRIK